MDIKKFKEWRDSGDYYKKLTKDSFVIVHDDTVNKPSLGLNIWSTRDIPDEWLEENQKDYPSLNIQRMKVSDIIDSNDPKFSHVKSVILADMSK